MRKDVDCQELEKDIREGMLYKDLTAKYRISQTTIRKFMDEKEIHRDGAGEKLKPNFTPEFQEWFTREWLFITRLLMQRD